MKAAMLLIPIFLPFLSVVKQLYGTQRQSERTPYLYFNKKGSAFHCLDTFLFRAQRHTHSLVCLDFYPTSTYMVLFASLFLITLICMCLHTLGTSNTFSYCRLLIQGGKN